MHPPEPETAGERCKNLDFTASQYFFLSFDELVAMLRGRT